MNAIANFIEETGKLDRLSQRYFDHVFREMASIEATIQAISEVVLELQNQLSGLFILQIDPVLPPEEENIEIASERDGVPGSQKINDYPVNIGPVNLYPMAGVLGDTLSRFVNQMREVAGIYTPHVFSEHNVEKSRIEMPGKKGVTFNKSAATGRDTPFNVLEKSALIIDVMETICDRMVGLPVEIDGHSKDDIPGRGIGTLVWPEKKMNGTTVRSGISKDIRYISDYNYVDHFSEIKDKMLTAFHRKILEAHEVSDVFGVSNIFNVPSLPGSANSEHHPAIYPKQWVIEMPAFIPREKVLMPVEEYAINATKLSNAAANLYGENGTFSNSGEPISDHIAASPSLSATSVLISNVVKTISDSITIAFEIHKQMNRLIQDIGHEEGIFNIPLDFQLTGNDAVTAFAFNKFAYAGNGDPASEGKTMNIAKSIASMEVLQKSGSFTIKDMTMRMSTPNAYGGVPAAAIPHTSGNILQILSGSQRETGAVPQAGGSAVHFHNTFNITVNVKKDGDESELRDLGRKIGLILSEELRRYGGIM